MAENQSFQFNSYSFSVSPHEGLVILSGHSEAGRVYKHDGIRTEQECKEIQRLWMASPALAKALLVFADFSDLIDSETVGFDDSDEFVLSFNGHEMQRFKLSDFRKAKAALSSLEEKA